MGESREERDQEMDAEFERNRRRWEEMYGDERFTSKPGDVALRDSVERELSHVQNLNKIIGDSRAFDAAVSESGLGEDIDEIAGGDDSVPTEELERQVSRTSEGRPARMGDLSVWEQIAELLAAAWAFVFERPHMSGQPARGERENATETTDPLGIFSPSEEKKKKMMRAAAADKKFDMSSAWCGTDRMIDNKEQ
jgi:hypothetical protein